MRKIIITFSILLFLASCHTSTERVIRRAENATFIIYAFDEFGRTITTGSGFFIDGNGTGITNFHVLDGSAHATVRLGNGREFVIDSVIASNGNKDIAKFTVRHEGERFNSLRFSRRNIEIGDVVYNIGSPVGIENAFSAGVVSSFHNGGLFGNAVQATINATQGSSGSPFLDRRGDVFAVHIFTRSTNLHFGIMIDQEVIDNLNGNDFARHNPQFNAQSNIVVLNRLADNSASLMLNAIEFGCDTTTLHLSFTHLDVQFATRTYGIWTKLNKGNDGFTLVDLDTGADYHIISSTVGENRENLTAIEFAATHRFRVFLPAIRDDVGRISIYGCGKDDDCWQFIDIDLDEYRRNPNVGAVTYFRDWGLGHLSSGNLKEAYGSFTQLIDINPADLLALNALGVISLFVENDDFARFYFSKAIDANPNGVLAHINYAAVYLFEENLSASLAKITETINRMPDNLDLLRYRIELLMEMEDYENLCVDIHTALQLTDEKEMIEYLQWLQNEFGCE